MSSGTVIEKFVCIFSLDPPVRLSNFKLPEEITVDYEDGKATKLEVSIDNECLDAARDLAIKKIKKVIALLALKGIESKAVYNHLYKLLPNGAKAFQQVCIENIAFSDSLADPAEPIVDVTKLMSINDVKFWRQLAHYNKGKKSTDPIERYREFYQVLEDENTVDATEKALRHAVNHPKLTFSGTVTEVTQVLGSPFFDPFEQKHIDAIQKYSIKLEEKAKNILLAQTDTS